MSRAAAMIALAARCRGRAGRNLRRLLRRDRGGRTLWRRLAGAARRRRAGRHRQADVVGNGHLRVIAAGSDGRRVKAIAFRMADSPLGEALLAAPPHRRLWLAGRMKRDDYKGGEAAELHLEDAAWADA